MPTLPIIRAEFPLVLAFEGVLTNADRPLRDSVLCPEAASLQSGGWGGKKEEIRGGWTSQRLNPWQFFFQLALALSFVAHFRNGLVKSRKGREDRFW